VADFSVTASLYPGRRYPFIFAGWPSR